MKLRNKKTGKIVELQSITLFSHPSGNWNGSYKSLKELNEHFEDYKPAEPLIKDEKIRKAVRAWAERCSFPIVEHYFSNGFSCFICSVDGSDYCLDFNFRIDNLEGSKLYYITELCGEEV